MLNKIKICEKCELYKNQKPLLDKDKKVEIFWVGLSAKKVEDIDKCTPLGSDTVSGTLLREIEKRQSDIRTYNTNIVKCLPLDENGKLRYPNTKEMDLCFNNLLLEINHIKPKIVFLLGDKVKRTIEKNLRIKFLKFNEYRYLWQVVEGVVYVPIHHPSYICVYKKDDREKYIEGVEAAINELLK